MVSTCKVAVLIIGEVHKDPAPPILLLEAVKRIHAEKIPIYFCEEEAQDVTLEEALVGNKGFVDESEGIIKNANLYPYLNELLRASFSLDNFPVIRDIINDIYPSYLPQDVLDQVIRASNIVESIKLKEYLLENSIPWYGIEVEKTQREEYGSRSRQIIAEQIYFGKKITDQQARKMSENIISLIQTIGGEAIILVKCGANHAGFIKEYLESYLRKSHGKLENYAVETRALGLHSSGWQYKIPSDFLNELELAYCSKDKSGNFNCVRLFQSLGNLKQFLIKAKVEGAK